MNKQDIRLIIIVLSLALSIFLIFKIFEEKNNLNALVYYNNKIVLKIDLNSEKKEYEVKGENGLIKIIAGNGKIKVDEENSPLHLCSKQGYISKSYETIVCLPNKVIIKIEGTNDSIDTIIK